MNRSPGKFGFEFTFTSPCFIDAGRQFQTDVYRQLHEGYLNRWIDRIVDKFGNETVEICPNGLDRYGFGKVTVRHAVTGLEFYISNDPWVFEVGTTPMTLDQLNNWSRDIQSIIFDTAKDVGLEPHYDRIGGGHMHLDVASHFHGNYMLFRNFIVDLMNRPELFLGAFVLDLMNAPPLAVLSQEHRQNFQQILTEFDSMHDESRSISAFCKAVKERVYYATYITKVNRQMEEWVGFEHKYQAINVSHIDTIGTLEIRGLRPQKNVTEAFLLASLFQNRIKKLSQLKTPIDYDVAKDYSGCVSYDVVQDMEIYHVNLPDEAVLCRAAKDYIQSALTCCMHDDDDDITQVKNNCSSCCNNGVNDDYRRLLAGCCRE